MRPIGVKILLGIIVLIVLGFGGYIFFSSREELVPELELPEDIQSAVQHKVIGTSIEGRTIEAYSYPAVSVASGNGYRHLVFVGGVHGGYEWNSVLLAYQFMDFLDANHEVIPENLTVTIIPSLNPDGVYKVVGRNGRFSVEDVPNKEATIPGRFNANNVDLNRNFDCKWKPQGTWRGNVVSAGTAPFSEPESASLKNFVSENNPDAVIFWHSQANAVYASECENGILPETRSIMNAYSIASGYPAVDSFSAYEVTGDAEGWLASIGIPAITVELSTHETIEWEKNLAGVKALFEYYGQ